MEPSEREPGSPSLSMRLSGGDANSRSRSADLAFVEITTNLLRKNERDHPNDELSDEEADAFGCC